MQEQKQETNTMNDSTLSRVVAKIIESENILIALSKNPSADELSAAIGLSIFLDKAQKYATAIYSGKTPSILEFLEPERRLEVNTDSLQDFIIALNKSKADHLHYKVEGDYVKIYITPYKTKISEEDLEFSHGAFNIGLVVALNVPNSNSLDNALTSHGRILHDAEVINISATEPGDFGEIQWSDSASSSVSEMVSKLVFSVQEEAGIEVDGEVATALLTGIFVATERFSNNRTKPETMSMAARLMETGANQQLISEYMKKAEGIGGGIEGGPNVLVDNSAPVGVENVLNINNKDNGASTNQFVQATHTEQNIPTGLAEGDNGLQKAVGMSGLENENMPQTVAGVGSQGNESLAPATVGMDNVGGENVAPATVETNNISFKKRPDLRPLNSPLENVVNNERMSGNSSLGTDGSGSFGAGLPVLGSEGMSQDVANGQGTSLAQMATPFEETSSLGFGGNGTVSSMGTANPQPAIQGGNNSSLSDLGSKSSVDEGAMNDLNSFANDQNSGQIEPLGKDYSEFDDGINSEETTGLRQDFVGVNPAISAAPGVSEGPEENHVPGIDFSSPVGLTEDEPALRQNEGLPSRGDRIDSPVFRAENSFVSGAETVNQDNKDDSISGTLEPKPHNMPLPGDEILPPPPTPPIDFGSIESAKPETTSTNVINPIDKNETIVQPLPTVPQMAQTQPSSQGLPPVDESLIQSENLATPSSFQQPQSNTESTDPGAFRIPGM